MSNIISFSLYGDNPLYCEGALKNAVLARDLYPGWRCRFYFGDSVPGRYLRELERCQSEMIPVKKTLGLHYGRYWRFWVASDPSAERFIVRDVDSRLNPRERAAVDAWIKSGRSFHIMRDSFYHRRRVLSGMWGGVAGRLPNIGDLIDGWANYDRVGQNDQFMSEVIFPLMGNDYLCHDSIRFYDDATPFPPHAHLNGTSYVGEIVPAEPPSIDMWRRIAELEDQRLLAVEKLSDCQARLDGVLASSSWRLTSPLRKLKGRLRSLKR